MSTTIKKKFAYDALSYAQVSDKDAPRFVLFHASAGDIVQWADVDRLAPQNPTGAQRPLHPLKVNKVAKYISQDKRNTIPTAVIIALDAKSADFTPRSTKSSSGTLTISSGKKRPGLIIDGQHRVFGAEKHDPKMQLNIVAMLGGGDAERAFQFVVINNTSSRVSKNHIKALNLQFDPETLNRRLLKSAGVSLGIKEGLYDDLQVIDLSPPFRGMLKLPTNENGFIPPNAIEGALAETKERSALLDIQDLELDVFLAIWDAIHELWKSQWNSKSKLLNKVSIYAITVYVLNTLIAGQRHARRRLDFTDGDVIRKEVLELMRVIPEVFWSTEWVGKELDTSLGRRMLLDALELIDANVRFKRPWYDEVSLIDPTRLPRQARVGAARKTTVDKKSATAKATVKKATVKKVKRKL